MTKSGNTKHKVFEIQCVQYTVMSSRYVVISNTDMLSISTTENLNFYTENYVLYSITLSEYRLTRHVYTSPTFIYLNLPIYIPTYIVSCL